MDKSKLALYGGPKAKTTPMGTGPRFGEEDLKYLKEAIDQNTLFYWYGNQVKQLTARFAELYGAPYCTATSSGTAAIHVALGICGVTAGDEVITSPVTDMGTIIGIVYQNAIPVFADLDPHSYTLDPKSVEEKITDKTKAIIAVHLTGGPTDMDAIMDIARRHNLKVIEDCAQSYMATYKGQLLGTIGDVGCFSLNDFKQISAGDGGLILTKTQEMYEAAMAAFPGCDAAICTAAVADYTPAAPADHKLKKAHEHLDSIELVETRDILASLCSQKGGRVVVGFAAETNALLANAQAKLVRKGADLIVANDVSRRDSTFGADTSRIALVSPAGVTQRETRPLSEVADDVLDATRDLLRGRA